MKTKSCVADAVVMMTARRSCFPYCRNLRFRCPPHICRHQQPAGRRSVGKMIAVHAIANIRAIFAKHKYRALPPSVSATLSCRLTFPQAVFVSKNRPAKMPVRESSRFLLTSSHQFCSAIAKSNCLANLCQPLPVSFPFPAVHQAAPPCSTV